MEIDREGAFFGQIFGWGIKESNTSAAAAVSLFATLLKELDGAGNEVRDCLMGDTHPEACGDIWYMGKNGKRREDVYQHLKKWLGWNGDEAQLIIPIGSPGALPLPPPCRIVVKRDDYKPNEPQYRIDSIGVRGNYMPTYSGDDAASLLARLQAKREGTWKPSAPVDTPADAEVPKDDACPF